MRADRRQPPEIAEVGVGFDWENSRLWALDLPVEPMPVEALVWHLDLPFWRQGDDWFVVTPRQVMSHPEAHPEHHDRIRRADLAFPAHVIWNGGRWFLLDGMHRLVKALQAGQPALLARRVPREAVPLISR